MKIIRFLIVGILALIVVSGVVYAVENYVIGIHVGIVPGNEIVVYDSVNMTREINDYSFGTMRRGEMKPLDIYILNNTDKALLIEQKLYETEDLFVILGDNTGNIYLDLPAGKGISTKLVVMVKPDATFHQVDMVISIEPLEK
jgi:hypothetical protein